MGVSIEEYRQRIGCFARVATVLSSFKVRGNNSNTCQKQSKDTGTVLRVIIRLGCLVLLVAVVIQSSSSVLDLTQCGDVEKNPGPHTGIPKTSLMTYSNEELNFFKFASIVLNEFPEALRLIFVDMWNKRIAPLHGNQVWDDSINVHNLLLSVEGPRTRIPKHSSFQDWDCTTLFQATLYARTFALPDSAGNMKTLGELYIKNRKLVPGQFHSPVASLTGDPNETIALAIDQLRLLRNTLCHSSSPCVVKATFDDYVKYAKEAFTVVNMGTKSLVTIANLAESNFPTTQVEKLNERIEKERNDFHQFLQSKVNHNLEGIKEATEETNKNLGEIEKKIDETNKNVGEIEKKVDETDKNVCDIERKVDELLVKQKTEGTSFEESLPKPFLPSMVPHFTGRQTECEELVRHLISQSTRLVTISGPPGFGKTSVAIAVGHRLKLQGFPVYFLSLRNAKSTNELMSKLLSIFGHTLSGTGENQLSRSTDELCRLLSLIPSSICIVLDNADHLFQASDQKTSQNVLDLLENIFLLCKNVTFLCTTRMSLTEFLKIKFQCHESTQIASLDIQSSSKLAQKLLQKASESECLRITEISGRVPLAIKILCGLIGEDEKPTPYLDEFCRSSQSIIDILDDHDSPSGLRLKYLFESSFERLSQQEQEAFVSLSVFVGESFDEHAAVKVIGGEIIIAKKLLRGVKRKSLIDSSGTEAKPLSFHPLIRSFAVEKAQHQMKEIAFKARTRFLMHYVCLFKDLNEEFLAGNSLSAFRNFEFEKENIFHCLSAEGISCETVCDAIFHVLFSADLFFDTIVYFQDGYIFIDIYDSAITKAKQQHDVVATHKLLLGRAFAQITWGNMKFLKEAEELEKDNPSLISGEAKGKRMCYYGIYLLLNSSTVTASEIIETGISMMSCENTILKTLSYEILALYFKFTKDLIKSNKFHKLAITECKNRSDLHSFFFAVNEFRCTEEKDETPDSHSQPFILAFTLLVSYLARKYHMNNIIRRLAGLVSHMVNEIELKAKSDNLYVPLFYNVCRTLTKLEKQEEACQSLQRVRDMVQKNHGHEHAVTAGFYLTIGVTQYDRKDYESALQSHQQALNIRLKLHGDEHPDTASSYYWIGITQHEMKDYASALQSYQQALNIRLKLHGDEHPDIANIYHRIGITQHEMKDYASALQSQQKTLNIRLKLHGDEHRDTAHSYYWIGVTQHEMKDYASALQSYQQALNIRLKLHGDEHPDIANSYHRIGITQHEMKDYASALQSHQKTLNIRLKLHGDEHPDTAYSYYCIGVTQYEMKDYASALQSHQKTLNIRLKLHGDEHRDTAHSYYWIGGTQHEMKDYASALQSYQQARNIRLKLLGDEHPDIASSYHA